MRHTSRFIRLLLGLTALATVWCLGCDAFDPLLAALFPDGGTTMVCASDGPSSASAAQSGTSGGGAEVAPSHGGGTTTSCGCESCHAPVPTQLAVVVPAPSLPHQSLGEPGIPPSIDRTPLVPPPQRVA